MSEMSDLFEKIAALDRKIADRWRIRTQRKQKPILSADDIDFILADLIKQARSTDINEKQGSAIVMLINASINADARQSASAVNRLIYHVNLWEKALRLNMEPIVDEQGLLPIADFLRGVAVSKIIFRSPGTNLSYKPFDYIAVGRLILNHDVTVLMSKTGGLSAFAETSGSYFHEENMYMILNMDPRERRLNIVHEATHIIQDWQDNPSLVHHDEADAFIAQAVAELTLFPDTPKSDTAVSTASLAAAKMIINKTAKDNNTNWLNAYKNVVKAVGRIYGQYGVRVSHVAKGEGNSEITKFKELLKQITVVNAIGDVINKVVR